MTEAYPLAWPEGWPSAELDGHATVRALIVRRTAEITRTRGTARRYLIDAGFHTEDGNLSERYGGPRRSREG